MGNENDNRTNLRAMAKTKTPPPPAVVITLDTDPFQVDVTTSNSHHPHVNQNHSQSNHHIHQNTQKSLSTHRDSLRVDSADSAVVKTNGGVGSSTATTGVRETGGSLCNARSRENSIGFEASAAGSSIDLNAFVGEQLAQEIAVSRKCCTENSRKVAAGVLMTVLIALSWVGAAHCLKGTYNRPRNRTRLLDDTGLVSGQTTLELGSSSNQSDEITQGNDVADGLPFDAPFFTTWLCTAFNVFFLPVFLIGRQCWSRGTTCRVIIDTLQRFQEKQLSFSQFFARCGLFTVMWIVTNFLLVFALRLLDTTDVLALYSAHVAFVYLLSWVILHEQFVGVRIVAIILVNTGVALLAYMDGVTGTTTLVGVVLSATAAGLSGVYKVTFKKLIGDVTFGQLAMFFSLIGFLNIVLLWPLVLCSYLLNLENLVWEHMPWGLLFGAGALSLTANLLGNLGIACTFEMFLTLGLAFAVPISAIVDIYRHEVVFQGMKLAAFHSAFADSRHGGSRRQSNPESKASSIHDMATGHRSGLRTASGRVK
ncbi:solute carrier family 35 member F4-like isoform X4 [Varroa jacobsoni]|uniref:solute carrier family 35 member F4-like isoform X4 n=1 Tax=Varroa jacobsoni TaxID=62625 RepID=UPI000BFA90A2|nr:solute carrier family 35 member F4-like isoform X4 [Varroa jacobsoni]